MQLVHTITEIRSILSNYRQQQLEIGVVPTMGALHDGHLSLMKRAIAENDLVVVTIFVNPLQFGANEDLSRYPRQLEADAQVCEELGIDVIFAPSVEEMYGENGVKTQVIPPLSLISGLCGQSRPGHFEGVATIVTKLLNIIQPDRAYFGEKDGQQLAVIRRLVTDLNMPVEIRGCPIVREGSGLALSSRNQYLSPQEREQALVLSRSLKEAKQRFLGGLRDTAELISLVKAELATIPAVMVEYVELVDPETMQSLTKIENTGLLAIAARVGQTRLIDNILLRNRQAMIVIDGPAGAGKSTVTKQIAEKLGLLYLDTGAMYRAITWLVLQSGIDVEDQSAIAHLVKQANLELIPGNTPQSPIKVRINGQDITYAIRTPEVTAKVSAISSQKAVRRYLVKKQQLIGQNGGIVAEGRDLGTQVFPDAELKIFLTASPQERAKRRLQDLYQMGHTDIDLEQLEREIRQRDYVDSTRKISPLQKAPDAILVNTDGLSIEQVTAKIMSLYPTIDN